MGGERKKSRKKYSYQQITSRNHQCMDQSQENLDLKLGILDIISKQSTIGATVNAWVEKFAHNFKQSPVSIVQREKTLNYK